MARVLPPLTAKVLSEHLDHPLWWYAVIAVSMSDFHGLRDWEYPEHDDEGACVDTWTGLGVMPYFRVGNTRVVGTEQEPGTVQIFEFAA